jgi:hypothetical protein
MACTLHYIRSHSQLYAYLGLGLGVVHICTHIICYRFRTNHIYIYIFIYTIKYDNFYSILKVNNLMRYEQAIHKKIQLGYFARKWQGLRAFSNLFRVGLEL